MRILRLVDDGVFAVEFHPYITVVADASADQRDRIARAFSEAAQGRTTELQGLIEVHGVELDLDERALDLLELDDSEVRTSLFAEDLPGATASGVDRQVRVAEDRLEALEQPNRDRTEALQEAGWTEVYAHVMKGTAHGIAPDGLSVALAFMRDKLSL